MDVRHQKAKLQVILQSTHVYWDDRFELEFRELISFALFLEHLAKNAYIG